MLDLASRFVLIEMKLKNEIHWGHNSLSNVPYRNMGMVLNRQKAKSAPPWLTSCCNLDMMSSEQESDHYFLSDVIYQCLGVVKMYMCFYITDGCQG
jgi:hypothetical protein